MKKTTQAVYEFAPFCISTTGIEQLSCLRHWTSNGSFDHQPGYIGTYPEKPWDPDTKTPQEWLDETGVGMVSCKDIGIYPEEYDRWQKSRSLPCHWHWVPSGAVHTFQHSFGKAEFNASRKKNSEIWDVELHIPYGKPIPVAIQRVWRWVLPA